MSFGTFWNLKFEDEGLWFYFYIFQAIVLVDNKLEARCIKVISRYFLVEKEYD